MIACALSLEIISSNQRPKLVHFEPGQRLGWETSLDSREV